MCRYWIKREREAEFRPLIERHWTTFRALGLVRDDAPHVVVRGEDHERGVFYVETFPWKDDAASERAHSLPEVERLWGRMGECCSSMEFTPVDVVEVE